MHFVLNWTKNIEFMKVWFCRMLVYRLHQLALLDKTAFWWFRQHTIKTGETNDQQQKKAKKSSSSNKRWQKKVGSLGCRYQSCNPAVNVWNVAERRPTIWEQINFVAVSSKWLGFDTFIEIYWNDSNKQLSKCSSALSTLVGWHFEASMPKIICQKFWDFSPKRLKYKRRKNLKYDPMLEKQKLWNIPWAVEENETIWKSLWKVKIQYLL